MADLNQWHWGHGRTNEYSVVWFYRIGSGGAATTSAYVSKDDKIVYTGCGDSLSIRIITDRGILYTVPYSCNGTIQGVEISIDAGKPGNFTFTATVVYDILQSPDVPYNRWIGSFTGGFVERENSTGIALWEMMGPFSGS